MIKNLVGKAITRKQVLEIFPFLNSYSVDKHLTPVKRGDYKTFVASLYSYDEINLWLEDPKSFGFQKKKEYIQRLEQNNSNIHNWFVKNKTSFSQKLDEYTKQNFYKNTSNGLSFLYAELEYKSIKVFELPTEDKVYIKFTLLDPNGEQKNKFVEVVAFSELSLNTQFKFIK